jgi:hypothetical protein
MRKSLKEKLWDRVDIGTGEECWEWQGAVNALGYGTSCLGLAHRVAYVDAKGDIPEGIMVLHTCDNPACCNPNHLWLGTNADNMRDMKEKGRGKSGWHTQSEKWRQAMKEQIRKIGRKPKSVQTRAKMSVTATGRRKKSLPDGSWTWEY